jgi:hypothetical protein
LEASHWDLSIGTSVAKWIPFGKFPIDTILVSRTGSISLTGALNQFHLWDHEESPPKPLRDQLSAESRTTFAQSVAALNSDGTRVLLAEFGPPSAPQDLCLLESANGHILQRFSFPCAALRSANFLPDDRVAISSDNNGSVRIWMLPSPVDFDRLAAEWVLSKGGGLGIELKRNHQKSRINPARQLPAEPFYVLDVNLENIKGIPEPEFARLSGLARLYQLKLEKTGITDFGLSQIKGLPVLRALYLNDTLITDKALDQVARFRLLGTLSLQRTQVTDAGVLKLLALTSLQNLHLNFTSVGDTALAYLPHLQTLQTLALQSTRVSDKGIEKLAPLGRLVSLNCYNTHVTAEGAKALEGQIPLLKVEFGPAP